MQLQREVRYEHPPIASLLIGVAKEADLVSPGFEQSTAISNHSRLDLIHSALRRASRPSWRRIVETAMLFERATI